MLVDPHEYRSFCFRGEGRANIVISAKHKATGNRIVWRFAKQKKSGKLSVKAKSEMVFMFMEMLAPLLDPLYLVRPVTVQMLCQHAHQLAKIPSLDTNEKVESMAELECLPSSLSFLPLDSVPKGVSRITCLQMHDATCIPKQMRTNGNAITVTVEIKPKQGFYQEHPGVSLPYCNNCILQTEKCRSATFERMYDFCPLDLFSGDENRMRKALNALFDEPHRNLRVFVEGDVVLSECVLPSRSSLDQLIFPNGEATLDHLIQVLIAVLTEKRSYDGYVESLLDQILRCQSTDKIGLVKAYSLFSCLLESEQKELEKRSLTRIGLSFLEESSPLSLLKQFFIASTLKDCSVMVALRLLSSDQLPAYDYTIRVGDLTFAWSAKIVDLDPKGPKNLKSAYTRFMKGAKILRESDCCRRPCVSP